MSGLLKEALKSLCDVNNWSYAVFWKFGCQNSKLLTWEEYYYEPLRTSALPCISELRNPELPFGEWEGCWGSETSSQLGSQRWDKVDLLVKKMMTNNRMKIVGQGLVGRAAFTGKHQWILAKDYITDAHPPEVLNEVHLQFSAGMQTVGVIPVLPHGVIQLGSSMSIMENPGFVNEVKTLVLNLGCIPGALLPNNYGRNECGEKIGIPVSSGKSISMDSKSTRADLVPKKESMDSYSFQALDIPVHLANDSMPFCEPFPSAIQDCPMHESENSNSTSLNVKCEGPCVQPPSVDDLFDVLGEDIKSKLLIGKRNNVSAYGPDIKVHNVGEGSLFAPSSSTVFGKVNISNTCSQTTSIYWPRAGSWVEPCHNSRRDISVLTPYAKRDDETTKLNRRRLKPRENPRPRLKDRQMILDRVNELREIVPNGKKCSIDALLGKTVEHMLFLQSITKHADSLKLTGESKIKEDVEGGATWAFEVGSQSMICPVVVEDLNPPRQMLVEMLCEERGFFLEIADLIRGLGLTILKGIMETRRNKIWARFAVEADRDVTRVEIFMSLVHLLEQTAEGGTSSADTMVRHSFPLAASVPATGRGQ
ncbi:hypothetical protein V6N13_063314 [Hibiscus sabdariffa]|uniref:Uncharacterized protein n=2 Tax=Hibiscus sabdariffa TaxID=183260 RepID=A0ABR2C680_9ROSI